MYLIKQYGDEQKAKVLKFLLNVLPESGRRLELEGRHKEFKNIPMHYEQFWCLYDNDTLIGTVGVKRIDDANCELKTLYLYESYHGYGLGYKLLSVAIQYAKEKGYAWMFLDTLATSRKAIHLYESVGFTVTKRYNENQVADVFMVKELA